MEDLHDHVWSVTELVLDRNPSTLAYATYCACGVRQPSGLQVFGW